LKKKEKIPNEIGLPSNLTRAHKSAFTETESFIMLAHGRQGRDLVGGHEGQADEEVAIPARQHHRRLCLFYFFTKRNTELKSMFKNLFFLCH